MRNEKGQAAIFVALMFNVLFVFFAMAINVALVVHDKINLQNSVDLATYYAAERQAEVLNAIAHQNYAIRQSWKLLTWRYRVLGTMGLDRNPKHPVWAGETDESVYSGAIRPTVCVTYKPTWMEVTKNENLCNTPGLRIPPLPQVEVIAGFLPINGSLAALSSFLRGKFDDACQKHGAYNWWFSMSILHAFRMDQRNRKQVIFQLAKNLGENPNGDFLDLDGNSVLEGARKTFLKNLTHSNRERFSGNFQMFNSLKGIQPEKWLSEIKINPTLYYTDVTTEPGCNADTKSVAVLPDRSEARNFLTAAFPSGLGAADLIPWKEERFLASSDFQFSIGVEKNPWYMVYVGIKAETTPRQIFLPIGDGVRTVARAFAKPFGGRIGPWNAKTWQRGAANSEGEPIDQLLPPRSLPDKIADAQDFRRLPNYSRFPGDKIGYSSKLALNSLMHLQTLGISYDYYKNIKRDIVSGAPNDILAYDEYANKQPTVRDYEIAAVTPDLFDIAYYSIEPNFYEHYWKRIEAAKLRLGFTGTIPIRPDLGFRTDVINAFSVQAQMDSVDAKQLRRPEAAFFVRDKAHLLTDWALPEKENYNYQVESSYENFGKCKLPDDGFKIFNPGSCIAGGGRTGYSVKIVSRSYLLATDHAMGGEGTSPNAIMNPPPADNGW